MRRCKTPVIYPFLHCYYSSKDLTIAILISLKVVGHKPHTRHPLPVPPLSPWVGRNTVGRFPQPSSPNYPLEGCQTLGAASSAPTEGAKPAFDSLASPPCQAGYTSFHHPSRLIEKSLMSECIFIRITYHHHPDDCAAECSHMGGNAPTVVEEVSI